MLLGVLCSVGVSLTSLSLSAVAKYTLDAFVHKDSRLLLEVCVGVVAVYCFRWVCSSGQNWLFAEVGQRLGIDLRTKIYTHLQSLSLSYYDNQRTGNLLSTFNNDVPVLQNGIMAVKDVISAPILAIGGLIYIFVISWRLALICVLILPMMAFAINKITKTLRAISLETQNKLADVSTITEETLAGARLVRAFGAENREIARYRNSIEDAKRIYMSGVIRSSILSPTTDLLGAFGIALAIWVGGNEVIHGGPMTIATFGEFVVAMDRIRNGVSSFGSIGATWKQVQGATERIFGGVLDVPSEVVDLPGATALALKRGEVSFQDVSFGYKQDRTVLNHISFDMCPGQVTALVGPSGAGKSTLADLVPRFYDPTMGKIFVDGQDIRNVTAESLREHIGIVPQDTIIFGGSVRENISYGRPDASLELIIEAAKHANAHDFIVQMPNGYDTIVGERGVMLSGGQRQRIAIARALLKDPKILILDEATSSLDETSQILVQGALETLMKGRTTLVIAHRLSTVRSADRIVVLFEGRIVESGSHSELLKLGGAYARLYDTQFRNNGHHDEYADQAATIGIDAAPIPSQ